MSTHEFVSISDQLNWKKARAIVAGVDVGAVSSKAMILLDGQPYAISRVPTRTPKESALKAMNAALAKTGLTLGKVQCIVGTGRGRTQVSFAHRRVSEISCGAAGAVHIWGPSVRTVLDAGGQSCRVIHCTEKGRATSFLWNDKCGAGIGRSMEAFANLVRKDLAEIGNIALRSKPSPKLSDFCTIYAQSEALDLMRSKIPAEEVIAGYHRAMAKRISTLVARAGLKKDLAIIGGLAKNPGIIHSVESDLKASVLGPKPEWDPQVIVALGAALIADAFRKRAEHRPPSEGMGGLVVLVKGTAAVSQRTARYPDMDTV